MGNFIPHFPLFSTLSSFLFLCQVFVAIFFNKLKYTENITKSITGNSSQCLALLTIVYDDYDGYTLSSQWRFLRSIYRGRERHITYLDKAPGS